MDESTGVLAVEGDTVVAGGVYRLDTPDGVLTADLLDLAVTADYQRQGLGLGREVLGLLEDRARKAGAARMTVYSLWSAQGFYKKLDYRLVGQFEFAKTL
jgi:ribosomal protein S18 acetylase RimI-like enzyme